VTLPDDDVLALLRDRFVVGWQNIERADYCGSSQGYGKRQTALGTTNGAGGRNLQIFVLSPVTDPVVLHALPGFWHPDDLEAELRFALLVDRLWRDGRPLAEKAAMFALLHRAALQRQSAATAARSEWQHFDQSFELSRAAAGEARDTVAYGADGKPALEPLHVVMRERMAQRPFQPFAGFDIESYVDYGRRQYDNNQGYDRGRVFGTLARLTEKREREAEKARRQAEREAKRRRS
jgi:hypothetical protein